MQKRLKYEKVNNCDAVISIDLYNGYSVIAVSGYNPDKHNYTSTLFIKDNEIDTWRLIEQAEKLEFDATLKTINSAVLKQVATYLDDGTLDYYAELYGFEIECMNKGIELVEKERLGEK